MLQNFCFLPDDRVASISKVIFIEEGFGRVFFKNLQMSWKCFGGQDGETQKENVSQSSHVAPDREGKLMSVVRSARIYIGLTRSGRPTHHFTDSVSIHPHSRIYTGCPKKKGDQCSELVLRSLSVIIIIICHHHHQHDHHYLSSSSSSLSVIIIHHHHHHHPSHGLKSFNL